MSPETAQDSLAGFTIGVTATRRREEFGALLERRGARVVSAPAIRLVPLAEDTDLLAATRECLAAPVDDVVITTGVGFRGWMAAAEGWGLSAELAEHLSRARLLTRGPKARGAVRAAGLNDHWTPASESCGEVKEYLLAQGLRGRRVAVQLHGEPLTEFVADLRAAGASVIEIPVYRWLPQRDASPLRRLVTQTIGGAVDAVAFTSAPAVHAMLRCARAEGLEDGLLAAFAGRVVAACVGPV
ncbi:MAG: uroporphyrinogen-III synthase, partial [Nonomuraea sp.]|nr:uroporphyrinogen-III synthase [Nonomuraea sp.]